MSDSLLLPRTALKGRLPRAMRSAFHGWAAAALVALASACSDGGDNSGADAGVSADGSKVKCSFDNAQVGIDRSAQFAVNLYGGAAVDESKPIAINSGTLAVGATTDVALEIKNTANLASAAELLVSKINVVYTGDDGAFECLIGDKDGKALLEGGKTVPCSGYDFGSIVPAGFDPACVSKALSTAGRFVIRFKKVDGTARSAKVVVVASGDTSRSTVTLQLEAKAGKATINVSPDPLDFGVVGVEGPGKALQLNVTNIGDADLQLSGVQWSVSDASFTMEIAGQKVKGNADATFDPPLVVPAKKSLAASVTFDPLDDKGRETTVTFLHSATSGKASALLKGNLEVPCVLVKPEKKLDLGIVYVGQTATKNLVIENCGTVDVEVSGLSLSDDEQGVFGFGGNLIAPTPTSPIKIAKNGKTTVPVTCAPPSENKTPQGEQKPFTAKLNLSDNSTKPSKVVDVQCYGTAATCPTAVIVADPGEQIEPQQKLCLKGSSSFAAPGKQVKKYKWKLVSAPKGATALKFAPNDANADVCFGTETVNPKTGATELSVNIAGEYVFELQVWDDAGTESCKVSQLSVLVIPSMGLHVELLWDTPADEEKDTGPTADGSDLDLHLVHPLAYDAKTCDATTTKACQPDLDKDGKTDPWFNAVYDCYWYNNTNQWGSVSSADNPGLDLDDTNGWGPENMNMQAPEDGQKYGVGVHYWDKHGLLPDDTTATVNIYVLGMLKGTFTQMMHECDMWWVKQVAWPSGDLVDFGGASTTATGKVTPKYWSILASTLGGVCSKPK